jgi:hypothetical protein
MTTEKEKLQKPLKGSYADKLVGALRSKADDHEDAASDDRAHMFACRRAADEIARGRDVKEVLDEEDIQVEDLEIYLEELEEEGRGA